MRYIQGLTDVRTNQQCAKVKKYLSISNIKTNPLNKYLHIRKGTRLKRGNYGMADAEDSLLTVHHAQHTTSDPDWTQCYSLMKQNLPKFHITLT